MPSRVIRSVDYDAARSELTVVFDERANLRLFARAGGCRRGDEDGPFTRGLLQRDDQRSLSPSPPEVRRTAFPERDAVVARSVNGQRKSGALCWPDGRLRWCSYTRTFTSLPAVPARARLRSLKRCVSVAAAWSTRSDVRSSARSRRLAAMRSIRGLAALARAVEVYPITHAIGVSLASARTGNRTGATVSGGRTLTKPLPPTI